MAAHDAIVGKARHERKLSGMGTTVTAVALVDDYWVLSPYRRLPARICCVTVHSARCPRIIVMSSI